MAFADRIGERLAEATRSEEREAAGAAGGDRLLPVLARREEQVDALFTQLVPKTTTRRTRITNGAGWNAGLIAADQAQLDARAQVRR